MARKGDSYSQVPTLWHIGTGMPCRVMRRRVVTLKSGKRSHRWLNCEHDVLTAASARRWLRLKAEGKAIIRRDYSLEMFMQAGIVPIPERKSWALEKRPATTRVLA